MNWRMAAGIGLVYFTVTGLCFLGGDTFERMKENATRREGRDQASSDGACRRENGKIPSCPVEKTVAVRARNARSGAFKKVLDRVPRRPPLPGDEL